MILSSQFRRFMAGRAPWRAQVLAPVLLVAGLWIFMSLGTTAYLWWVEAAYDRVFSQNLTSINTAHTLESICWKTLTDWDDVTLDTSRFSFQWESDRRRLEELVMQAKANAHTADEKVIEVELGLAVKELGDVISSELGTGSSPEQRSKESGQRIREFARQVATNSQRLRTIK